MKSKNVFVFGLILMISACEDIIEVGAPKTQLIRETVFEDDLTAMAAISGLYSGLTSQPQFTSISYLTSLSSDEMIVELGDNQRQFIDNELLALNPNVSSLWTESYSGIYRANSIIEGLENSVKITSALKNQLNGEARFYRAFYHFYLVNLFGEIPYVTTTDYRVNGLLSRLPVPEVYEKMVVDLIEAKTLLSDDYAYSAGERVRVNKWAATALLARVYLFMEDWVHAEEQATTVINKTSLYALTTLDKVFLKNSIETIWQLVPPYPQKFTNEGGAFSRSDYSPDIATISNELFDSFETGDNRKNQWIGSGISGGHNWYYPYKYKENFNNGSGAEYSTVFRLAEQHLIRAEARIKQNKLMGSNGAEADINIIRNRAGLPNTTASTQTDFIASIEQERRVELFTEWGHRWVDLKRTGRAIPVLRLLKTEWDDTDVLYPIPFSEIQLNPNLKPQNDGY